MAVSLHRNQQGEIEHLYLLPEEMPRVVRAIQSATRSEFFEIWTSERLEGLWKLRLSSRAKWQRFKEEVVDALRREGLEVRDEFRKDF